MNIYVPVYQVVVTCKWEGFKAISAAIMAMNEGRIPVGEHYIQCILSHSMGCWAIVCCTVQKNILH